MTEFEEKAMMFEDNMKKLGWIRQETGRWIERLIDEGQGFPYTEYSCPFCQYKTLDNTRYCPNCGARLGEKE